MLIAINSSKNLTNFYAKKLLERIDILCECMLSEGIVYTINSCFAINLF